MSPVRDLELVFVVFSTDNEWSVVIPKNLEVVAPRYRQTRWNPLPPAGNITLGQAMFTDAIVDRHSHPSTQAQNAM